MNSNFINLFEKECNKNVEVFISAIKGSFNINNTDADKNNQYYYVGFPIFKMADNLYLESRTRVEILEFYLRTLLVNPLLNFLFIEHNHDIRWKDGKGKCNADGTGLTNQKRELRYPIEFFIVKNGKNTAYRYSPLSYDPSIPLNLPANIKMEYEKSKVKEIHEWVTIDWKENATCQDRCSYGKTIGIKNLFEEFFSIDEYSVFVSKITDATSEANQILGFQTIPRLSSNNINVIKGKTIKNFNDFDFKQYKYYDIKKGIDDLPNSMLSEDDVETIQKHFFIDNRRLLLIQKYNFAESFVTSDYLFNIFNEGIPFDYTSVVCGYLKAIEQLCSYIIYKKILPSFNEKILFPIKKIKKIDFEELKHKELIVEFNNISYLPCKQEYSHYFIKENNITMKQLFDFFDKNRASIFEISDQSVTKIITCLTNYRIANRNGYFHKDNINEYEVVKHVRDNTYLIAYWLLGSLKSIYIDDEFACVECKGRESF